jgi:hypothetical protein
MDVETAESVSFHNTKLATVMGPTQVEQSLAKKLGMRLFQPIRLKKPEEQVLRVIMPLRYRGESRNYARTPSPGTYNLPKLPNF